MAYTFWVVVFVGCYPFWDGVGLRGFGLGVGLVWMVGVGADLVVLGWT